MDAIVCDSSTGTDASRPQSNGNVADMLSQVQLLVEQNRLPTMEPLLSLLFNIRGKPFSLEDHFHFAPMFRLRRARTTTFKCARQIGKSQSGAVDGVCMAAMLPHFATLFITPLFEQIRRFSTLYIRPLIQESPLRDMWMGTSTENSVLQRTFKNGSRMIFSFALTDADRCRGLSVNRCNFDEIQDIDRTLIPIIKECMAADRVYELTQNFGTSKTTSDALAMNWNKSSQAEWWIPCLRCTTNGRPTWNIPSTDYHIYRMLGPHRADISAKRPGLVCYKCEQPIFSRLGHWEHRYPDRRWSHAGFHIPQAIVPLHYEIPHKWGILLGKQDNPITFHNEVLGEAMDAGQKLISRVELENACRLPWANNPEHPPQEVMDRLGDYKLRVLGIDWGGGGEDGLSTTVFTLTGLRPDGRIDVLWAKRSLGIDHIMEAHDALKWFQKFRCDMLAHDYTGAGVLRETFLIQAGIPMDRIMPFTYVRSSSQDLMTKHPATHTLKRDYWAVDKTRSLHYTIAAIRTGLVKFFKYDYVDDDRAGLIEDFLHLIENRTKVETLGSLYRIISDATAPDDFAQAVNIACLCTWEVGDAYPDFAKATNLRVDPGIMRYIGADDYGFDDLDPFERLDM